MNPRRRTVLAGVIGGGARRRPVWIAAALALLLGAFVAPAQAGIVARNQPDGRCVVTASVPGVGPWDLRLERRDRGRWIRAAKPTTWTRTRAIFPCAAQSRARIRVRPIAAAGQSTSSSTIRQPAPITPQVRVVYARPRERPARAEYATAVTTGVRTVQQWYLTQLGRTFHLSSRGLERCVLPRTAAFYRHRSYDRVLTDLQACVPLSIGSPGYTWLIYADVEHACNTPGQLGVGTLGLAIQGRQDLDGIAGLTPQDDCGNTVHEPYGRWAGGMAHELGHAFGLGHPPACERRAADCDMSAVMWLGYTTFPATHFTGSDRKRLARSPYLTSDWQ